MSKLVSNVMLGVSHLTFSYLAPGVAYMGNIIFTVGKYKGPPSLCRVDCLVQSTFSEIHMVMRTPGI